MPVFSTILSTSKGAIMLAKSVPQQNLVERNFQDGVFLSIRPESLRIDIRGVYVDLQNSPPPEPLNGTPDELVPGISQQGLFDLLRLPPNYDSEDTREYEKHHVQAMFSPAQQIPEEVSKGAQGPNDGSWRYNTTGIDLTSLPYVDYDQIQWNVLDFGSDAINRRVLNEIDRVRQICG